MTGGLLLAGVAAFLVFGFYVLPRIAIALLFTALLIIYSGGPTA